MSAKPVISQPSYWMAKYHKPGMPVITAGLLNNCLLEEFEGTHTPVTHSLVMPEYLIRVYGRANPREAAAVVRQTLLRHDWQESGVTSTSSVPHPSLYSAFVYRFVIPKVKAHKHLCTQKERDTFLFYWEKMAPYWAEYGKEGSQALNPETQSWNDAMITYMGDFIPHLMFRADDAGLNRSLVLDGEKARVL